MLNHMRLVLCQHCSAPENQCPVSLSPQMLIFTFFSPSFLFCSVDVSVIYIYVYRYVKLFVLMFVSTYAAVQLYIYLDTSLFYCESDYNWRTPKIVYTFVSSVNTFS